MRRFGKKSEEIWGKGLDIDCELDWAADKMSDWVMEDRDYQLRKVIGKTEGIVKDEGTVEIEPKKIETEPKKIETEPKKIETEPKKIAKKPAFRFKVKSVV